MHRVVIFTNSNSGLSAILVRSALAALASRDDMELAAICLPKVQPFANALFNCLMNRTILNIAFSLDPLLKRRHSFPLPIDLNRLSRRLRFKILIPSENNINHPHFIALIRNEVRPTIALSLYYPKKFGSDLLLVFKHAVNYHNGLLPAYRGLKTTAWSIYHGEQETGFAFHHMTKGLDEGPILTQEALPIHSDQSSFDIELEKAIMAAKHIPHVLRMIAEGNPGKPQFGKGRYFSMADYRAITGIQDPAIISSSELTRRLRAFEHLQIKISGGWREVTKIAPLSDQLGKMGRFCFQTSDKVMIKPMRFRHLPFFIMRLVFTLFLKRISRIIAR